jgi:allantoinase
MESLYDYGARVGFWRLHRLFTKKKIPVTVFAVGMALERNPLVCRALKATPEWEIASHGYRWWDYKNIDEDTEREHIRRCVDIHTRLLGKRPVGFYQGKPSINTRRIIIEEGGFKYDSDSYADDLPYWYMDHVSDHTAEIGQDSSTKKAPHLVIPYTLTANDMRFVSLNNFSHGGDFCQYLKDNLKYVIGCFIREPLSQIIFCSHLCCILPQPYRIHYT